MGRKCANVDYFSDCIIIGTYSVKTSCSICLEGSCPFSSVVLCTSLFSWFLIYSSAQNKKSVEAAGLVYENKKAGRKRKILESSEIVPPIPDGESEQTINEQHAQLVAFCKSILLYCIVNFILRR